MIRKAIIALLISCSFLQVTAQKVPKIIGPELPINPYDYQIIKNATVNKACVVSAHPLASMVGLEIMKLGGNAYDAAIATQWALAVVYPGAGNIGGGGFILGRNTNGTLMGIDYRESAPENATRDMYVGENGVANTNLSQYGHLAAGVPGTVAGLYATLAYAKLPMATLIQPAIDLAQNGFSITEKEASSLNGSKNYFVKFNTQPTAFVKQTPWKAGDTLVQKELANTLKRIQQQGQKGFYEGETAKLVVAEMKRGNGIISLTDLKNYKAKVRTPLITTYRHHTVISFAPPSSGGILLTQMLKMVEPFPMRKYGFHSAESVQLMVEVERRAYADRAEHLGDPDFYKVPTKTITSNAYLAKRMQDYKPGIPSPSSTIKAGNTTTSEETTHLNVIDKEGNMVAVTTTLNGGYGSKTVVGGAGFLLNNEMDDFSVKPGVPNMYGAVGGEANAIAHGKRMLSSMCPTLVLKRDKPFIIVGTPGGTTIPTSVFQSIVNIIDFNMNASDAVNKPKFHHQWLPDEVYVEKTMDKALKEKLIAMGYKITERGAIGRTEIVKILPNGSYEAAADTRGDDSVAGY